MNNTKDKIKTYKSFKDLDWDWIEYWESSNVEDTKKYEDSNLIYKVLRLNWSPSTRNSEYFVSYPDSPTFLELSDKGGGGSSRGNMVKKTMTNPWKDEINEITIQSPNMLLDSRFNFNFLELKSRLSKDGVNRFGGELDTFNNQKTPKSFNENVLEKILENDYYLGLPEVYEAEYFFDISKVEDIDFDYLLVLRPKYEYDYDLLKACFISEDGRQFSLTISQFSRYRDGGTTNVKFEPYYTFSQEEDKKVFELYVPTNFKPELMSTLNGIEIFRVEDEILFDNIMEAYINN